mgnify:CR=1 FL=1
MHGADWGVLGFLLGSVLFEVFQEMGGLITRPDPILADMMFLLKLCSEAAGMDRCPLNTLTITMLRTKTGPKLKSESLFWNCFFLFVSSSISAPTLIAFVHLFDSNIEPKSAQNQQQKMVANRSLDFCYLLVRFWLDLGRSDPQSDHACAVETHVGHFWRCVENLSKLTPK